MTTFEERDGLTRAERKRLRQGFAASIEGGTDAATTRAARAALAAAQSGEQPAAEAPAVVAARCPGGDGHAQITGPVQFVGALTSVSCATCGKPRAEWVIGAVQTDEDRHGPWRKEWERYEDGCREDRPHEAAPEADEREALAAVRSWFDDHGTDPGPGGWHALEVNLAARRAAQTTTVTAEQVSEACWPDQAPDAEDLREVVVRILGRLGIEVIGRG